MGTNTTNQNPLLRKLAHELGQMWRDSGVLVNHSGILGSVAELHKVARRVASTLGIDCSSLRDPEALKVVMARLDEIGLELAAETRSTVHYKVFVRRKGLK